MSSPAARAPYKSIDMLQTPIADHGYMLSNGFDKEAFTTLLLEGKKIIAVGECGLDYHYIETFFENDKKLKNIS